MTLDELLEEIPVEKFDILSREELAKFAKYEQKMRIHFQKELKELKDLNAELEQKSFYIEKHYISIKNKFFGKSSEKEPKADPANNEQTKSNREKPKKQKVQLPSLRYPNAPLIERHIELQVLPKCPCCAKTVRDLGLTEDSEFLTVVPAQYMVVRQKRHKYGCGGCYGTIITAPAPPTIKAGSSYSDAMKIDIALGKFCDLTPVERYSAIAGRAGLEDLPQQSLIESTHHVADFVKPVYEKLKVEIVNSRVLHADETPHRMLEGDEKSNWYLWGFSNSTASYFEIHNTRSGSVASELLINSKCEFLMSDVFSGYNKAVKDTNIARAALSLPTLLININCNAHSRRKFKEAKEFYPDEAQYFIDQYKEIYRLDGESKGKPPDEILKFRMQMRPIFEAMKIRAMANIAGYSSKSSIAKAMSYFLNNYEELTLFITDAELPIDNNLEERQLRNPVIGRKTWYGTHSKRGAETAAILFSIVESCKLVGVNPREYFKKLVEDLHLGKAAYTPREFKDLKKNK